MAALHVAARPEAAPYQTVATSATAPADGNARKATYVSMSHPVSMSRCLNVSAGLGSLVSGLTTPFPRRALDPPLAKREPAR